MKLGVMVAGRSPEEIGERLAVAREAGFFLSQINLFGSGMSRADILKVADACQETGVRPIAIGCYVNPMKPDESTPMGGSREDLVTLMQALELLGARKVVLWSGTHASSLFGFDENNRATESLETLRVFLQEIARSTRARNYQLLLEPWNTHVLSDENAVLRFHDTLDEATQRHVRYVLDAPSLLTQERYAEKDGEASKIVRSLGPVAGVVHLKDIVMPPDGDAAMPGPGLGTLEYPTYIQELMSCCPADTVAVIRNVPLDGLAEARDYMLRLSSSWQLS